jgi:hypothetical protein
VGLAANERVSITFVDSVQGRILLGRRKTDPTGAFTSDVTIPATATLGTQHVRVVGRTSGAIAKVRFTVT